jgi:hypothetical protein
MFGRYYFVSIVLKNCKSTRKSGNILIGFKPGYVDDKLRWRKMHRMLPFEIRDGAARTQLKKNFEPYFDVEGHPPSF